MKSTVTALLFVLSTGLIVPAWAGEASDGICLGRVAGVGDRYNPATGSGFLAVRAGPKTAATQLGQLFEGDRVVIVSRSGGWLNIMTDNQQSGWVYSKYINSSCK